MNERGFADAPRVGARLRQQRLMPDVVISSDAVRARQTAEAAAGAAGYAGDILLDRRLYLAEPADILSVLQTMREDAGTVLIVGHNPGLEELVETLTGDPHGMPTAALSQVALPIETWGDLGASTRGTLVGHWEPNG